MTDHRPTKVNLINFENQTTEVYIDNKSLNNVIIYDNEKQPTNFSVTQNVELPSEIDLTNDYYNDYNYDYSYYDWYDGSENQNPDDYAISVRKCCNENQYFDLDVEECIDIDDINSFKESVEAITFGIVKKTIKTLPGNLTSCPGTESAPLAKVVSNTTHQIYSGGLLLDSETGKLYDHTHYCLELVGNGITHSQLNVVYCPMIQSTTPLHSTRKCCSHEQYFSMVTFECEERSPNMTDYNSLVSTFARTTVNISVESGLLTCEGEEQQTLNVHHAYLINGNQLCLYENEMCYTPEHYCIEDLLDPNKGEFDRTAVVCAAHTFHKCCELNHISKSGSCSSQTNHMSPMMTQLIHTLEPRIGFPDTRDEECTYHILESDHSNNLQWWIENTGDLIINSGSIELSIHRYCVDDNYISDHEVTPIVYTCKENLKEILPLTSTNSSGIDKIRKCCPAGEYFDEKRAICVRDRFGINLKNSFLQNKNLSFTYTSDLTCNTLEYHQYYFKEEDPLNDHIEFDENLNLVLVSFDGKCVERKTPVLSNESCIDFWVSPSENENTPKYSSSRLPPVVVRTCIPSWESVKDSHKEKYPLTSGFLAVSCICLVATVIALATIRVRRGLVTVKKVKRHI